MKLGGSSYLQYFLLKDLHLEVFFPWPTSPKAAMYSLEELAL